MGNLLYTNIIDFNNSNEKKYEEQLSLSNFKEIAQTIMDKYNMTHKSKLNLVLFK